MAKIIPIPQRVFSANDIALHLDTMIIQEKGYRGVIESPIEQKRVDAMNRLKEWANAELKGDVLDWYVYTQCDFVALQVNMVDGPVLLVRHPANDDGAHGVVIRTTLADFLGIKLFAFTV